MSFHQKKRKILYLLLTLQLCTFKRGHAGTPTQQQQQQQQQRGGSVTSPRESAGGGWGQVNGTRLPDQGANQQGANLRPTTRPDVQEPRRQSAESPGETLPHFAIVSRDEPGDHVVSSTLSWTYGNISSGPRAPYFDHEEGYQADYTGFHGAEGQVLLPGPQLSEWQDMRPVVQCDENVMTLTASGEGLTHLLVDREPASPIPLSQLPPYCGYSVRSSWTDLEMMATYDACYITQQNGSYVLPLLWGGRPLKLSCPVQTPPLAPPAVFCSPDGMAVQKHGPEEDIPLLGVKVDGGWSPFVSEHCASLVHSKPGEFTFFISYTAPCIINWGGLSLHLVLVEREYILSCPPLPPPTPEPVSPAPSTPPPPEPPTQPPVPPHHHQHHQPWLHYAQVPQVYPPGGPQPATPPQPPPGGAPRSQVPPPPAPTLDPAPETQSHRVRPLPRGAPRYPPGLYYHLVPLYYPAGTPAPSPAPPAGHYHPHYDLQVPYYYHPLLVTQATPPPTSAPPSPPPKPPVDPLPPSYHPYYLYHYYSLYHPLYYPPPPPSGAAPPTVAPSTTSGTAPPTTTTTTALPHSLMPQVQCGMGRMVAFLPFAHPDSIQVKGPEMSWWPLSSQNPLCGYMLQMAPGAGVILHSPLPACHSLSRTPSTVSFPLKFWDLSVAQYRTLELQCAHDGAPVTHVTPAPATSPVSTAPTSSTTPSSSTTTTSSTTSSSTTVAPDATSPPAPKPRVSCSSRHMNVKLPAGPISGIVLKDLKGNELRLQDADQHCGYSASKGKDGKINLSLELHSRCHMSVQGKMHIIWLEYTTGNGRSQAQVSCPVVQRPGKECHLPSDQRLPCGPVFVSQPQCLSMGCCFGQHSPACYYPMDECTIDHHFVFSIPASIIEPPLSPALLVAGSNGTCRPQRVTSDFALFKIPMDACGARRVVVGKMVIYMVEVVNKVQGIRLNHGTITRDSPVRFLVECRFQPGNILSVSYLVKTPTLSPGVQSKDMFGVQLRIAKDAQYSSYHPQYHQPLQMLLGKPLYLEVQLLNAPDPSVVLLVHYCVAYPRSRRAVWVLLYNGCPNPLDPVPHQVVLSAPQPPAPRGHTRRFTISTFQFLPDGELKDPNEEIYFMCSTEICSPREGACVEGCFSQ